MKENQLKLILIFGLTVILFISLSTQVFYIDTPTRSITKTNSQDNCVELFANISRNIIKATKPYRKKIYEALLRIPVDLRMAWYINKAKFFKDYERRQRMSIYFIDEINYAVRQEIFSEKEASEILEKVNITNVKEHFQTDGKVQFTLVSQEFIDVKLALLRKHAMEHINKPNFASEEDIDKALEGLRNLRYDYGTLKNVYETIEKTLLTTFDDGRDWTTRKLVRYLEYLSYQPEKDFMTGLRKIDRLFDVLDTPKIIENFNKIERKREALKARKIKKFYNAIKHRHEPEEAMRLANKQATQIAHEFEHLQFACHTKKATKEKIEAAKKLTPLVTSVGLTLYLYKYVEKHWDEEKNLFWFERLGHEAMFSLVFLYVGAKVLSSSKIEVQRFLETVFGNSLFSKWVQTQVIFTPFRAANATAYGGHFWFPDGERKKVLKELENDPEKMKLAMQFIQTLDNNQFAEKFIETLEKFKSQGFDISTSSNNDELQKDFLLEVIAIKKYENESESNLLNQGDPGADRFLFDTYWSLGLGTSRELFVNYYVFKNLCLMQQNPAAALTLAALVKFTEQWYFSELYRDQMQKTIGQKPQEVFKKKKASH